MTRQARSCGALLVSLALAAVTSAARQQTPAPARQARAAAPRAPARRVAAARAPPVVRAAPMAARAPASSGNAGSGTAGGQAGNRPDWRGAAGGSAGRGGGGVAGGAAAAPAGRGGAGGQGGTAGAAGAAGRGGAAGNAPGRHRRRGGPARLPAGLVRRVQRRRRSRSGQLALRAGLSRAMRSAQWYQPENARVEGGRLVIEARRERQANPSYEAGTTDWPAQSRIGRVHLDEHDGSGQHGWQYGRFEMRARIDTQAGLWPAWWTLGSPAAGRRRRDRHHGVLSRQHPGQRRLGDQHAMAGDVGRRYETGGGLPADWSSQFHAWRMDWNDRRSTSRRRRADEHDDLPTAEPPASSPFRHPHYMLVNLAIGGTTGATPPPRRSRTLRGRLHPRLPTTVVAASVNKTTLQEAPA